MSDEMSDETKAAPETGGKNWPAIIVLAFALVALAAGTYQGFIKSHGYVRAKGVVVSVKEETYWDSSTKTTFHNYYPTIKHSVAGKEYVAALDLSTGWVAEGAELEILYDPQDPAKVHLYSPAHTIACFVVGAFLLGLALLIFVRGRKREAPANS